MVAIPYIDIHTHSAKKDAGVVTVQNIFPGAEIVGFTGRNFYSVGLHPWFLKGLANNNLQLNLVEDALELDHVVMIGECGLDKTRPEFDEQKRVFEAQAFMAEEFRKPLIIHCVKAWNEIVELHDKMHPECDWILHGYNGGVEITRALEKRGLFFSFGEALLKNRPKVAESFSSLPLEKIFIETDEFDGDIREVYRKGAQMKNITADDFKKSVWQNFNRIENIMVNSFE